MSLKSHFGMVFLWKKMLPYEKTRGSIYLLKPLKPLPIILFGKISV